jgi:hypothetical protein
MILVVWGVLLLVTPHSFPQWLVNLQTSAFVGTAFSQLGLGFALTVVAIWLVPRMAAFLGSWIFLMLAPGPSIGASGMLGWPREYARNRDLGRVTTSGEERIDDLLKRL